MKGQHMWEGKGATVSHIRSLLGSQAPDARTVTTVHTVRVYTCEPVFSRSHTPILVLGVDITHLY
eukprot:5374564-Prymnesium_polylepis.1